MAKKRNTIVSNNILGTLVGALFLIAPPMVIAEAANDLDCTSCVGTTDLANKAVGTAKLKNGAVTTLKLKNGAVGTDKLMDGAVVKEKLQNGAVATAKLKNGAVTYAKLSSDLKAAMDDAEIFDYRDYGEGPSASVTQRVYAVSGIDLWQCGGAGTVDTEVRDTVRTLLPDGSTHIADTYQSFTGGVGGTPCDPGVYEYIADADGLKSVRHVKYLADGITVSHEINTTYDIDSDPSAGLKIMTSDMQLGIDFISAGQSNHSNKVEDGLYFSEGVLMAAGVTATVDQGGPNEETVSNCVMVRESRLSTDFGYAERIRTMCPGIGMVTLLKGEPNTGKTRIYRLIDYTDSP